MTSIGQRLKEAREEQRLTLDKVFESTRIRVQYLRALEADDLSVMPSPVQARGYLRNYAEYLGLDVDKVLEEMRLASSQPPAEIVIGPADDSAPSPDEPALPVSAPDSEPILSEYTAPLVKPKPARHKKTETAFATESVPTTKRRSRKKVESEPLVPTEPEVQFPPSAVEEPIAQVSSIVPEAQPPIEEVSESPVEPLQPAEPQPAPDASNSLWQSWLNRITAILAARNKRPTLVQNEAVMQEMEANPVLVEPAPPPEQLVEEKLAAEQSTQIFKEIGQELRKRRELLSLHLEEVERNTHVKAHYLDALERGAMEELPSTVQTRGMLSNYATFLDLDVDALLLRFADALQARHRERNPYKPTRKPGQPIVANLPPMRSFIAGDLIFGVGIVVLLVGFAIWGVSRVLELQSQREVQPTAPSISDILLSTVDPSSFTATPTFLSVESFPGAPTATVVIPTLNADVNVQVNLVAVERTYMRVIADGETVFEGRVVPGTAYPFEAVDQIEVLVGSGAAIRIVYNGRDMGLLGSFGQVVSNIYQADAIVTPTGMPSPTATITLTPTKTPVPTSTSRFTATPVLSATPVP